MVRLCEKLTSSEEEDEEADECDLSIDGRDVVRDRLLESGLKVGLVKSNGDTNDGNDELADKHAKGTIDEERTTTETLDGPERQWSRKHVDQGEDEGDQEGVLDRTSGLQEGSRVVEDEVDT